MSTVSTLDKETSQLLEDWDEVLVSEDVDVIEDSHKKAVTARLLENQDRAMMNEAPANSIGAGAIDNWDPILISMVRRSVPKMIAFDIFGVQPMSGPTGLIFAMKSHYDGPAGAEALHAEPNSGFSGDRSDMTTAGSTPTWEGKGTPDGAITDPSTLDPTDANLGYGIGMQVADMEKLGDENEWNEMGFSIEKSVVSAKGRGLRATWSVELTQDLKAVHGLDAETELSNILSTEILNDINREMIRRCYVMAKDGSQDSTVAGTFDLNLDSDGRWAVEKFKGLMFQVEKEANAIAIATRRGKGNFIITSANVASAMAMTNLLDNGGNTSVTPGNVDPTGTTFVGTMNNRTKVFVDPYASIDFVCIGFKGATAYDAGAFYCPYVPLSIYRATTEDGFQPRIGFKTRYGFAGHPFAGDVDPQGNVAAGTNKYYRIFKVANL